MADKSENLADKNENCPPFSTRKRADKDENCPPFSSRKWWTEITCRILLLSSAATALQQRRDCSGATP
jgi:hypothetical protein